MRRAVFVGLILLAGIAGAIVARAILDDPGEEPATSESAARPDTGSALVAGAVDRLVLSPTLLEPVTPPITIEPLERGAASATITPVTVGGEAQSLAWPGGTPFTLRSSEPGAALTLDPVSVEVSPAGTAVDLEGAVARLTPGVWIFDGSVALGRAGLGQPLDTVTLEATESTTVTFTGPALLRLPPEPVVLEGPGEVALTGDVEVTTAGADQRVDFLRFGPGPYRFDLLFAGDFLEVDGRLEGELSFEPPAS